MMVLAIGNQIYSPFRTLLKSPNTKFQHLRCKAGYLKFLPDNFISSFIFVTLSSISSQFLYATGSSSSMQHCLFYSCAIKFYFELWVLSFYHITPKAIQSTQFRSYGQHLSFSSLFCTMDSRYLKHELKFYCKYFHKTNSNGNEIK